MNSEFVRVADESEFVEWSVKDSFWRYVLEAGGTVSALEPARMVDDGVRFPRATTAVGTGASFAGGVTFSAHRGVLSVAIRDPALRVNADGDVVLSVAVADGAVRWDIASADSADSLRLTIEGAVLLGSHYRPGTELARLRFG